MLLQDTTQQTPAQKLVAKDLHGYEWHFRHTYRGMFTKLNYSESI